MGSGANLIRSSNRAMRRSSQRITSNRSVGKSLQAWQSLPESSVPMSFEGPVAMTLSAAMQQSRHINIRYNGGTYPNQLRSILPLRFFMKGGESYVEARCARQGELRIFKFGLITIDENIVGTQQVRSATKPNTTPAKGSGCVVLLLFVPGSTIAIFQIISSMIS